MTVRARYFAYVLLLLASSAVTSVLANLGFLTCRDCLPIAIHDAPGVGFDLTAGYGTSSVNFYNGSTRDLVKVEATQQYKDLMIRLSSAPKPLPTYFASIKGWLRKKRGLSITTDVGIISDLIVNLKDATETELGYGSKLDTIVLTHMFFPALTAEDIGDAIEFAGLKSWLHVPNIDAFAPNQLSENRAVLAAHGVSLCQECGSWTVCLERMSYIPEVTEYFVSLTRSALFTSLDTYLQPFEKNRDHEQRFFDSSLGLDHLGEYPSKAAYWAAIREKLVPQDVSSKSPITHVLVGGEAATMPELQDALRKALAKAHFEPALRVPVNTSAPALDQMVYDNATGHDFDMYDWPTSWPISPPSEPVVPLFAASRGAALLSRWRQEAPLNC